MTATSLPRFGKPPGSHVTLRIKWHGPGQPHEEDIAMSSGGSLYFVESVRKTPTRYKLVCMKLDPRSFDGEPDWYIEWDRRG